MGQPVEIVLAEMEALPQQGSFCRYSSMKTEGSRRKRPWAGDCCHYAAGGDLVAFVSSRM
jgi:hypothetical protein